MGSTLINPYAAPAFNGVRGDYPHGYVDQDFTYVYEVNLLATQLLRDQVVPIQQDADFYWRANIVAFLTGAFQIRFSDSQGYYLSNGFINSANFLAGGVPVPMPVFPEIVLPAGGRIGIDIQDLSAAPNVIQILFRGVKRYRLPAR